ncbi:TolC family outer membrane protein [Caenimonas terrae]|uniref:TolC family outer membrane protein n=1 Tax=Caenimonas terrae TaxID=696074 RepID=A0ABW0NDB7_9BURK
MRALPRRLAIAALALAALSAQATDLMQAWQAAREHDPDAAIALAGRQAGETRRAQAAALWRPTLALNATVGAMNADTAMTGARFSAPGFGQSDGVNFATSIHGGTSTRWGLSARQPLVSGDRQAQRRQLLIGADAADLEWQASQQELMLRTAQRYFDAVLAERKLELLQRQQLAVDQALVEARDRFAAGDKPITDTHEASARARALQAQVLAAESELQLAREQLSDVTGLPPAALQLAPPAEAAAPAVLPPLEQWLELAGRDSPQLRLQQANAQSAAQEVARRSARAGVTLDLVAEAGRDRLAGSGDFGSASNTASQAMVGLQLTVPLSTGGMRSARQDEALRLQEKADAEVERTRQQVRQQTRAAWLGLQTGKARLQALAESLTASRARLDATQLGRQVGDRTTLDLLNAQNDASGAELALVQARADVLLNRLRLAALAGGLDEARLQEVNAALQR